jgi:MFS family permease
LKIFLTFSPALRWNLGLLFAAGLCFWAGLAGFLPTLPLFIETLGANGQQIGLVMATFAVGLLLARPSLSRLADQKGRKRVLMIGLGAIALAPFGYLLVQAMPPLEIHQTVLGRPLQIDLSLLAMMLIRAFHGLSIAAFVVAYSALVVDISPPDQRGELIGYMSLVNPIGMALGPALGGFLYEGSGFSAASLAMGLLGLIGLLLISQIQENYRPVPISADQPAQLFWRLLWTARVRTPAVILLLVGLAFGTLSTFVPLYVREADIDLNVGLIYTTSALTSFGIRLLVGRASDRYGRGRFITASLALYTVSMLLFWAARSAPMFLIAGLVQGAAGGTLIPMIAALMGDRARPDERGRIFGLVMVGFDIGIALAGPVFGSIADSLSYRDIFGLAGLMTFVGLLFFATASSKDLNHSLQFSLGAGPDVYAIDR